MLLECMFAEKSCMYSAANSLYGIMATWGPHCKGFRNAPLQQIEMGQSTDLTPLVSLLFLYIPKSLAIFKENFCGVVKYIMFVILIYFNILE